MKIKYLSLIFFISFCGLVSCSKKSHPAATGPSVTNNDTIAAKKVVIKRKPKEPVPKVISVNDLSAKKTVDGRYYYDLQKHRYWKNFKDGKYYLFSKAMYENDAFKPN